MAKKTSKGAWGWAPAKPARVPEDLKVEVETKANALIEDFLKSTYVKPPPEDARWNYLTGISTKWHRSYFYFIGHYASPGPNALSPTFESNFTRLEYAGERRFHLAYFRHTNRWCEVFRDLTLDESMETIRSIGIFHPA